MKHIEQLLRERMGLDAASIGSTLIRRTVRFRMRSLGLKRSEEYGQLLEDSAQEWTELLEAIVVTETWFFRDPHSFSAFGRLVWEEWLPAHPAEPLRLLSLPCSSGEEPYSMVMELLNAGVRPERFQVDAVDISARALARAVRGIYGRNSFRSDDLAFRKRYFDHTKEGYVLHRNVRTRVNFWQANLLSGDVAAGKGKYDFIFCRNLLIYFDRLTQRKALWSIGQMLAPSGLLFVGPAELSLVLDQGFVSAKIPMAFACRKNGLVRPGTVKALEGSGHWVERPHLARSPRLHRAPPFLAPSPKLEFQPPPRRPAKPHADLDGARRLADSGLLREASEMCEAHLSQHGPTAQAYYLLGVIRDSLGDERAADCYRKALYLEPNHYETLLQMALLSQKNGDAARARALRRRAQRVFEKTGSA